MTSKTKKTIAGAVAAGTLAFTLITPSFATADSAATRSAVESSKQFSSEQGAYRLAAMARKKAIDAAISEHAEEMERILNGKQDSLLVVESALDAADSEAEGESGRGALKLALRSVKEQLNAAAGDVGELRAEIQAINDAKDAAIRKAEADFESALKAV